MRAAVQAKKLPVVGGGTAVFSFAHVDDVAAAFAAALTGPAGTYNVVDDEPAPVAAWLPSYAQDARRQATWPGAGRGSRSWPSAGGASRS